MAHADCPMGEVLCGRMQRAFKEAGLANELIVVPGGQHVKDYLTGKGKFTDREQYRMPGLVLLDLKMPGISGLELLKWIRAQPAVSTIPVVMFSSSNQESDVHSAYAQGANAYLLKPARADKLSDILRRLKDFGWSATSLRPTPRGLGENSGMLSNQQR